MYQPTKPLSYSKRVQRISKLESEYQQNQNRIHQLLRRNQELSEEVRLLSQRRVVRKTKPVIPSSPKLNNTKSIRCVIGELVSPLSTLHLGPYSVLFWLKAMAMLIGVGLICGSAGFMLVRLISSLI